MNNQYDVLIVGGGAAGFFTAVNLAEMAPNCSIAILERGSDVLTKVKVSGGGRCNVSHAEFIPSELASKYPRGEKELLGPFHTFMTGDTITWFENRGVPLKIEEDGRMFPETNSSQTIIDCFLSETERLDIDVLRNQPVKTIKQNDQGWEVSTKEKTYLSRHLVMATGSNPKIWQLLRDLGHQIVEPVPSLFTFNTNDEEIHKLSGINREVSVRILNYEGRTLLAEEGPLLITHWGFSGPAILKLSAWGARLLHPLNYQFTLVVNWMPDSDISEIQNSLRSFKDDHAKKKVWVRPQFDISKRLWQYLVGRSGIREDKTWADLNKAEIIELSGLLHNSRFDIIGKSTFKEEFVTAGGILLKEVDFKSFQSKIHQNLYFAGEILDIDAITGGFNFQNAWTGGYLVARHISKNL